MCPFFTIQYSMLDRPGQRNILIPVACERSVATVACFDGNYGNLLLAAATTSSRSTIVVYCSAIPARAESSLMGSQSYVKKNSRAASITNKVSNSSHQISPPYSSTTFASPPFLSRAEISIPIDHHSDGLLMAKNHRTQEKQSRGMSFFARHLTMAN